MSIWLGEGRSELVLGNVILLAIYSYNSIDI